jgi:hypothetical protein
MADDSQDKFNEPGYKKDVAKIKSFFSSTSPKGTRFRYNQPSEASTEKEVASTTSKSSTSTPSTSTKSEYGSKSTSGFGKAFSEARKAGNKDFEFEGKKYAAVTKEEVDKSGSKNLSQYLSKNKSTSEPDLTAAKETDKSWSSGVNTQEPTGDTTKTEVASSDSSDIFSGVKKMLGLRKGGMPEDVSMERARGVTPEQFAEEHKAPHSKNKYKDGGDIHVTKGHDYIKDLL